MVGFSIDSRGASREREWWRRESLSLLAEMQTLTLCKSLTRPHFHPLHHNIPSKPPSFPPPTSPASFLSSPEHREHSRRSSLRCSRQWPRYTNTDTNLLRQFQQAPPSHEHGTELRLFDNNGSKSTTELAEITNVQHLMVETPECLSFPKASRTTVSIKHDRVPLSDICGGLKLALLIGFLTFQGSQQAVAGTEFAGETQPITYIGDLGDISTGFASAFLLIFFSELGDKTFFIAAFLAARSSGAVVFIGTFGALAVMSIVSVIIGRTFHYVDGILPFRFGETDFPIDDFAAVCLLVYFGVTTLLEAASGDELKGKEEQKEAEVVVSELSGNGAGIMTAANTMISTFLLVFVAEWGDKSFFSTIALAAASSPLGVIGGALVGHALATLLAVLGGSILGTFVSEKVIAYVGGSLFLVFAMLTLIEIVS